ncbi:MAG TPA: M23 family metallopeptidase [Chthoniobacterales bacterium]|jgi:murein DD-endopeptidase MepM/ murein hydrolase activator NlpD
MNLTTSKGGARVGTIVAMFAAFLLAFAAGVFLHLPNGLTSKPRDTALQLPSALDLASLPTAARFDFPIGSEHGAFTYNAQPFTQNRHLGDDLNGIGGENSDIGDPVDAVADGRVIFAQEGGPGWGKIIIVLHAYEENGTRKYVESYYAHLQSFGVGVLDEVKRGQQIATVGNADGKYLAHLHFEMREFVTPFVGAGYREDTRGWLNPSEFIAKHRGAPDDDVGRAALP